jgi:hypothetical protein
MDKDARTMTQELATAVKPGALTTGGSLVLPAVVADQGEKSAERFFTFFTDTMRTVAPSSTPSSSLTTNPRKPPSSTTAPATRSRSTRWRKL